MQTVYHLITELFGRFNNDGITAIDKLPLSGGDREYFRIHTSGGSYIATYNKNIAENNTFAYFTRHFRAAGCPLPEIYVQNKENTLYIQEDLGSISLLNCIEKEGHSENVLALYRQALKALAHLQVRGDEGLDYTACITSREFGRQAIMADLLYFKYYFLDTLKIPYDKEKLIDDFEALSTYLTHVDHKYFMYRDFQSRNIMIRDGKVFFIDYQGGMKGALQYDVASLLWQAKAEISDAWKNELLHYYISCVEGLLGKPVDRLRFESQYNGYVLLRLLQVLGAYGFRGLFERKAHFLTSIPLAIRNLGWFLQHKEVGISVPEFERLLNIITGEEIIGRFENIKAGPDTPLTVTITSFSYRNGIPADGSGNGGGYVFDMRGILNPGRIDEYKTLSGQDKPVKDFLEQQTRMPDFMNNVYNIVDVSVEDYIRRGFASLMVNFGCTGGQHRSVYAAEALARHLRNKFGVKVHLMHTNKENWVKNL